MLAAEGLYYAYPGSACPAVDRVSCAIQPGEIVALMGASGSGKTTLARMLGGALRPAEGKVSADGVFSHVESSQRQYRSRVGIMLSEPDYQLIGETVEEELAFGLANQGLPPGIIKERVAAALKQADMEDYAGYPPRFLSGGQKQKLLLLAFHLLEPAYLILDEPLQMLDNRGKKAAGEYMLHLARNAGRGILFCTHDIDDALGLADRILIMQSGRLTRELAGSQVFIHPEWLREAGIRPPELSTLQELLVERGMDGAATAPGAPGAGGSGNPGDLAEVIWHSWFRK